MFGSVPLRTYLPDGDIDLTALYSGAAVHGWMERLRDVLVAEEHNPLAEFSVRDIQTINAEVRCSALIHSILCREHPCRHDHCLYVDRHLARGEHHFIVSSTYPHGGRHRRRR